MRGELAEGLSLSVGCKVDGGVAHEVRELPVDDGEGGAVCVVLAGYEFRCILDGVQGTGYSEG